MRPNAGAAGRNAQPLGEGLGEGLGDRSRRLMSGTWLWKDPEGQEDLDPTIQHAVPSWAADRFAHSAGPGQDYRRLELHAAISKNDS